MAAALLLAVSGSKSEPPSRPSSDWSKQRPYFGSDMQRDVSVELGKTAYLTCKVFELGDKTVSWLIIHPSIHPSLCMQAPMHLCR